MVVHGLLSSIYNTMNFENTIVIFQFVHETMGAL